jgi:hypothetical protein
LPVPLPSVRFAHGSAASALDGAEWMSCRISSRSRMNSDRPDGASIAALDEAATEIHAVAVRDPAGRGCHDNEPVARKSTSSTLWVMKKNIFFVSHHSLRTNSDLLA